MCSCCTKEDAKENTGHPFYDDIHLYMTNLGTVACDTKKCEECDADQKFCLKCKEGN